MLKYLGRGFSVKLSLVNGDSANCKKEFIVRKILDFFREIARLSSDYTSVCLKLILVF